LALGLGLLIRTDKHTLAATYRAPAIGAQFKPFTTFLLLGIDQMPEVELALAAVLGAELDVPSMRSLLLAGVRRTLRV